MSELGMKDRAQIETTVHKIDLALGGRVPRKKRREIRDELRSNLTEAATNVGTEEAIRQLGDLPALTSSYVEVYRGRWDLRTMFWTMVVTYAVLLALTLVLPYWPIASLAIVVLIGGVLSLVPVALLWLARRIARMMRETIPAPPSVR